jgi:hypothetical protein
VSSIPDAYLKIIEPLIATARGFLENGEKLASMAFVGSFAAGSAIPVLLETGSDAAKDKSALGIKLAAEHTDADFIFILMEAWSLRKDKMHLMEKIYEKYGSIGASPYAVDIVSMTLETRHGVWVAEAPIKPKGISKKRRTFSAPEFRHFTEMTGRFSHLLPEKDVDATSLPTLH